MADKIIPEKKVTADVDFSGNPWIEKIKQDAGNRQKWASRDRQIQKRRLTDRPAKKNKPYPGAPNFVVPIVDDVVREKTDQEITMMSNARFLAYFIPMGPGLSAPMRMKAQLAFDTYLRHVIQVMPKLEEALDCKNARGFSIVKVVRTFVERWGGEFPDIDVRDPADLVVPVYARRDLTKADRICDVYRYSAEEFERMAEGNPTWKNVEKVLTTAAAPDKQTAELQGALETLKDLIGVQVAGDGSKQVVLCEFWHYADEWTCRKAVELYGAEMGGRILKGRKCKMLFCLDAPEDIVAISPWREKDTVTMEDQIDPSTGMPVLDPLTMKPVQAARDVIGKDRSWPYIQARYENRSPFYYDSRGVGQLVMDDQIAASATRNCKHILMDYYQLPQYRGTGTRNSPQITHEPGGYLPEGVERVDPAQIPMSFDFTVDQFRREAGRRCGAGGQYEFSDQMAESRKVQKTAAEVRQQSIRGDMVSTASVDRFVSPIGEIFMQLWEDLGRLQVPLPMIANRAFLGQMEVSVYEIPVLIIPVANAKTLNPDLQFQRDREIWGFLATMAQMGVVVDPQRAAIDILGNVDPEKMEWVIDPSEPGPALPAGGAAGQPAQQQPVYMALGELKQTVAQLVQAVQATAQLAQHTSEEMDKGAMAAETTAMARGGRRR